VFTKRGVIMAETIAWWKGLGKELELDIESLDKKEDKGL
jgi:hypothetical protein